MHENNIFMTTCPLEARNGTIVKHGFFIKVPRDLPLCGVRSRCSRIFLSHATIPARDQYNLNSPTFKITVWLAASYTLNSSSGQGRDTNAWWPKLTRRPCRLCLGRPSLREYRRGGCGTQGPCAAFFLGNSCRAFRACHGQRLQVLDYQA